MDTTQQFGLDQIADTVNRAKLGTQRAKREAMRLGQYDSNTFSQEFSPQIAQAQQPQEFAGAGRKEVTPDMDMGLLSAVGGMTSKYGGKDYYYSPYDMSTLSWGNFQDGDQDLGQGKYNIMRGGSSVGTGYKSLSDTLTDFGLGNQKTGNQLKDWELLGQHLNYGKLNGNLGTPHSMGGNQQKDPITGLNTLYGSTPILQNGSLIGYSQKANTTPESNIWNDQRQWQSGGGFFTKPKQHYAWDVGGAALGREYNDQNWWLRNASPTSGGNLFIKPEDVANSPGWNNADFFERQAGEQTSGGGFGIGAFTGNLMKHVDPVGWLAHGGDSWFNSVDKNGLYNTVFDRLDPWLDDLIPHHEFDQNNLTQTLGNETQKETFQQIAPAVVSAFVPFGGFINAADSANQGNYSGALASAIGQAISMYAPTATPTGTDSAGAATGSSGVFGSGASLGSVTADRAAQALASNTLTGAIANGGNIPQALKSAAFSTASGAAGDWLSKALTPEYGEIVGKSLGGAASGGLNSLFSGNNAVNGSLFGAMSGGLHGFLNSTDRNANKFNEQSNKTNYNTAQNVSKLAKLFTNRK